MRAKNVPPPGTAPAGTPPTKAPRASEVSVPQPFHVDLPQYISAEARPPRGVPLKPVAPPVTPRSLGERLKHAATSWKVKGTVQRVLGVVPGGRRVHQQLQLRVGGLKNFDRECDTKVDDWRLMMEHLNAAKISLRHACLLEIGSGWYPTFPVCLYLAGAQQVRTVDLTRMIDPKLTLSMVERLGQHLAMIARLGKRDEGEVRAAHARLLSALSRGKSLGAATESVIDYRAPSDASRTSLASNTVDVVFSNSVLEHVPGPVIEACFAEAMRILHPGGIMFHSVNCGDHYAYTDRTLH
ncbi:MAG TPA: class I SAM-dependent methyltransferase, partial [Kofleriaceae bacterium]|nr:class I SAM-dependent methyltransferase [Kofleriaceae bacterium]